MDSEFIYTYKTKQFSVIVSGEHTAFGEMLTSETSHVSNKVEFVESLLASVENQEQATIRLQEWQIDLSLGDVTISHISTLSEQSTVEEAGLNDWQHYAECGVEDFIELLGQWLEFIQTR